ncbi:MAG TPA: DUF748 domain-containing protein [Polyangiales bacterium]|nr:DUF748 domain-containing protein [Polyangiales bacterium]
MGRRTKILLGVAGLFVFAVVVARLIAPVYILGYVNRTLEGLDGYTGRVNDIDLGIWRGAYVIKGINIEKTTEKQPLPFVSVEQVDISVNWSALLKGQIVSEIELTAPKINLQAERKKETAAEQQVENREKDKLAKGEETSWQKQIKELIPLDINRVSITRGEFHFRDPYGDPKVDVPVRDIHGSVTNLTNSDKLNKDMVAHADFRARALKTGKVHLDGQMDPYAEKPTFTMKAELEQLQIKELNDFLQAYANVDAEKGTLNVYTEVESKNGRSNGYVKPMLIDLKILRWKDEKEGFFGKLWEGMAELGKDILRNRDKKQVATRIPLSGRIEKPDADIFATVMEVLRNAFIEALRRGLEPALGDEQIARREGDEAK